MLRIHISILLVMIIMQIFASDPLLEKPSFQMYVDSVLSDSENRWSEYPKCPEVTIIVLSGLEKELKSDSAKYYFEKLRPLNIKKHSDYMTSLQYFEKNNYTFCLLAMAVHANPDCRTYTIMSMCSRLRLIKDVNLSREMSAGERLTAEFLLFVFEMNQKFIVGGENSTISKLSF